MKKLLFVFVFLLFSVYSYSQFLFGTFSPLKDWKKIETKYFEIYFTPESQNFASKVYSVCDEVYELLKGRMNSGFDYKFPVIVVDSSDLPNGFYMPIPRPRIVLYSSMISKNSDFFSDDDVKILFLHELTHALASEPARGFWSILRAIFGYYVVPNLYLPGTFLESITVFNESSWGFGRINNPMFSDILLADVYYGKFRSFYKSSLVGYDFSLEEWYLYGGLFFDYLREKYGYEKVVSFYTENSYYMPNFFYLAFKNTFGRTIFEEWDDFRGYASTKLSNRISNSELPEFLTSEGWYKNDFRLFDKFIIYSQSSTKTAFSGLKYISLDGKQKGFLLYERYIGSFDIKGNTIAFTEYVGTRYEDRFFLKFAKLGVKGNKVYLYDEIDTGISGVYKVALKDEKIAFLLIDKDGKSYLSLYSQGNLTNIFTWNDRVGIDIDVNDKYLVLLSRVNGNGVIEIFDLSTFEKVREVTNIGVAFSVKFSEGGSATSNLSDIITGDTITSDIITGDIITSSIEGDRVNVFSYDIGSGKISRLVKPVFAVYNPIRFGGNVYGISISKNGYDIARFNVKKEDVVSVDRAGKVYLPELEKIKSKSVELTNFSSYGFFNNVTPLYILSTFFPIVEFNNDFSLRRLGVLFEFYDEPLEFRECYIDFSWDFNANAVDYTFTFKDSSVPYINTFLNIFRYHIVSSDSIGIRLNEIGYSYSVFTFDYGSVGVSGGVFNNYISFYPFVYFSLPSFNAKDSDSFWPSYSFANSSKGFFSPYLTTGFVISTLRSSIGAITSEEGWYFSSGLKLANDIIGSRTNGYVSSSFFALALRIWGNNVFRFDVNFRTSDFFDAFGFGGFRYPEFFPVSERGFNELNLFTYSGGVGRNYLTSSLSIFVKFFDLNEGIWPIYLTSFWGVGSVIGGMLFNELSYSDSLSPKFEARVGVFFNIDIPGNGYFVMRNGLDVYYNFESGKLSFRYWLLSIPF